MYQNKIMDKFIKDLDSNLDYLEHKIKEKEVIIYVASNRTTGICPYCRTPSGRIHSYYLKCFQDFPIMGKKTTVCIDNRKFFCDNPECRFKIFAERLDFLQENAKKTSHLIDKIMNISLNMSSVYAAKVLKDETIMINIETHKVINIIDSRDTTKVTE